MIESLPAGLARFNALHAGNRLLMLSRLWMRRIASPKSGATEATSTFRESTTGCVSIESVIRRL
jgi:hypothetical protein